MTERLDPEVKDATKIEFGKIRSERMMGEGNHFFGKHHTDESNELNPIAHKQHSSARLGKHHTEESKEKLRNSQLGVPEVERPSVIQPSCGKYKFIALTKGCIAIVDAIDYERICSVLWIAHRDKHTFYARRALPKLNGKQRDEKMHHLIIGRPPKGMMIDHINGNGLDNRKCNLRIVTNRVNCMNLHTPRSGNYPGITLEKKSMKWVAQAQINGKHIYIGTFKSEEQAHAAYIERVTPLENEIKEKCNYVCKTHEQSGGS